MSSRILIQRPTILTQAILTLVILIRVIRTLVIRKENGAGSSCAATS